MSAVTDIQQAPRPEAVEKGTVEHVDGLKAEANTKADAIEAENSEYNMTVVEAVKAYPCAVAWSVIVSSTIIVCPSHL
jgi:SP family general alpha glucoside:H+ symporter-like MFS transporter